MPPGTCHMWDHAAQCAQIGAMIFLYFPILHPYWTPVKRSAWGIAPGGRGGLGSLLYVNPVPCQQSTSNSCCLAVVNNVPLHPIASLCMLVDGPLASVCPSCDRTVPMVLWATDEPLFFLSFVLPAACAHVQ